MSVEAGEQSAEALLASLIFGPLAVIGFHFGRRASAEALDHLSDAALWSERAAPPRPANR